MPTTASIWSARERLAWECPEQINPAEWAERHRVLTRRQTSRPGRWRNEASPYLVGVMLMCVRPGVELLTILKAAQVGVSEAIRNVIGYLAHLHPDPVLLVLPNKESGESIIKHRIVPLFEDTPVLAKLTTGRSRDITNGELLLDNGFTLRLGWSGSPSSLASHPARKVFNDERSKFADGGKEADPESLAEERTVTFADSTVINLSTPAEEPDPTAASFEASQVKLYYFAPCPHCDAFQRFVFDRLRWEPKRDEEPDKNQRAALIVQRRSAWMECEKCGKKILDEHKRTAMKRAFWGTEDRGWKLFNDGREEGTFPVGTRVGMHLPALYSLAAKHTFVHLAAQFVRAEGDPKATQAFYNSKLGEVFRQQVAGAQPSTFAIKSRPDPETGFVPIKRGTVAPWASRLLMTVDTQKDHFYAVIRAWGHRYRSHRVWHAKVSTFEEIAHVFFNAWFPYQDNVYPALRCHMLGIDSGGGKMGNDASRTDEVYRFCLRDPAWLKPLKGEAEPKADQPFRLRRVTYQDPAAKRDAYTVHLLLVNSGYFNDVLASAVDGTIAVVDRKTGEVSEEPAWLLNDEDDEEYNRHLANMHKIRVRGRAGRGVERWVPKTGGARVDYRACEVYQFALAHGPGNCGMLPPPEMIAAQFDMARRAAAAKPKITTTPDGRPFLANQR